MPNPVRIEMSGEATLVVQAGSITGGVHLHPRHAVAVDGPGLPDLPREHDQTLARWPTPDGGTRR
ncbi:hypothetical protein ACQPYE_28150 [Actinosynnema sp. CA-299493]